PVGPVARSPGANGPAPVPARASEPLGSPEPLVAVPPRRPRSADRDPTVAQAARDPATGRPGEIEPSGVPGARAAEISRGDPDPREIRGPGPRGRPALPALHPVRRDLPRPTEAQPAGGRRAQPDPPIVRVSIGRIEVRAVTPPAPVPPRPAPVPQRSGIVLEEYLSPRGRER
ncbi:MAG: hypothetical protein ACREMX_02215, partial [Gemmatimonadales bacterium]